METSLESSLVPLDPSKRAPMGALLEEKKALRTIVRRKLRQLSPEQRAAEDDAIQKQILASDWFQKSERICGYISCGALREVATEKIVSSVLDNGNKVFYVPRVEDSDSHMRMLEIRNTKEDLIANKMNILEPTPVLSDGRQRKDLMTSEEPLDLMLIPGLSFDRMGGRLGRGGGYYDLFIQTYLERVQSKGWKRPLLVALSYKTQIQESVIPMDQSDVRVDFLVSVDGVLKIEGNEQPVILKK